MRFLFKKIYLILFLFVILFTGTQVFGRDSKIVYSHKNITNYFSGIISADQNYTDDAFKYLNKVQILKNSHSNFNIQFVRTLILLEKFEKAFSFLNNIDTKDELFFEANLLLGIDFLFKKDYINAEKYFTRLNEISVQNLLFKDFLGNVLISWSKADQNNKEDSFYFFNKIPNRYNSLKKIQKSFLNCYFDSPETIASYQQLVNDKDYGFSRYAFFFANYLLSKNKVKEAEEIIKNNIEMHDSNLLLKQSKNFILTEESQKIKNFFNCKNPRDNIAEIFYVMANFHATQEDYQLSNFFLKISFFLNNKFTPNKALLAENYYYEEKYDLSKKLYSSLKSIGEVYSWYASKTIATILIDTHGIKDSISTLEKEFNLLSNPSYEHYYELANFYKDNEYYEKSIKYYSLVLEKIENDHPLTPKILDRRGTSYEREKQWDKAEKDLLMSLQMLPDQPYVLNYLAYSWIEKGINIDRAFKMLKKAADLKKNDGYIIDSLGWAYYVNQNYIDAKKFLEKAVELMPLDPIINDHYADTLWMLNKNIQARYFWKHVLSLDNVEQKLKNDINKKLIFGITKKL